MDKNLYGKSVTENIYKNIQNKLDKSIKLTINITPVPGGVGPITICY
jgi:hypothetical protein